MGIVFEKEKDLEDLLFDEMIGGYCPITGFEVTGVKRQYDAGGYGIIDLLAYSIWSDEKGDVKSAINIYELKNGPITIDAIGQISRYARGVQRAMEHEAGFFKHCRIGCHLVGNDVSQANDAVFITEAMPNLSLWLFKLDPHNGIRFEQSTGWRRNGENLDKFFDLDEEIRDSICELTEQKSEQKATLEAVK